MGASLLVFLIGVPLFNVTAMACTRAVYIGGNDLVVTGRSMDWKEDLQSNLWIFPRGMERSGNAGENSLHWVSKYGSVVTSAYEVATTDGMNEKGLVANLLWLVESEYPHAEKNKPALTLAAWAQYVLDNFANVNEAVTELSKENFTVMTANVPGQERLGTVHLALSDSSGDSAILEYLDGKLVIHHGKQFQVLTNSPTFDKQLAINEYWEGIGGMVMMPGTNRAADRFVRANYYINAIPKFGDDKTATSSVMSVIRSVSVPFGITTPDEPNISSTRWRTVSDHKNKLYYFESALMPNTFWVDLKQIDFSADAGARKLALGENQTKVYSGEVSALFTPSAPFHFLEVD
ncbi:linear amide C-N hydrolase [Yersinia nurmii]|uniref:Linear amide C-N hydrolase n=1 Tax=Yersinia nurmii TaxID=685706 RepID=A0AAW7K3H1_9GAMM|nr:linear amide C-N hydrolase [Yersinia nurmii]MDN0089346.1 linear amide C-N hydrolase [Yersinia nurmii]